MNVIRRPINFAPRRQPEQIGLKLVAGMPAAAE